MAPLTELDRYERYLAFCLLVGAPTVLPLDEWRWEMRKIPELGCLDTPEYYRPSWRERFA